MKTINAFCFVVPALLLISSEITQAQDISKVERPSWVTSIDIEEASPDLLTEARDGVYDLVLDSQIRWQPSNSISYERSVQKVIDRSGLEAAGQISIEFDPSFQKIQIHSIKIKHDNTWEEVTNSTDFDLIRRENDLTKGVIDGRITALINLKNLKIGDEVDFEYSTISTDPVFRNDFATALNGAFSVPVGRQHFSVSIPTDLEAQFRTTKLPEGSSVVDEAGFRTYDWQRENSPAVPFEQDAPSEFPQFGFFEFSTWQSWAEISSTLEDYYQPSEVHVPAYADKISKIELNFSDPTDRITEALRLVQDEIRYMSLAMGAGGYIPRSPEQVIQSGYGDCKDKALLLVSILKEMGIESHVALVHSRDGKGLPDRLPAPGVFNHAIVKASIGSDIFWLDPTQSHQGGRGQAIPLPNYAYALVIDGSANGLEAVPHNGPSNLKSSSSEIFTFPPRKTTKPIKLEVTTTLSGRSADHFRYEVAASGEREIRRSFREYYEKLYPGIMDTRPFRVVDDRDQNRITTFEYYSLPFEAFEEPDLLTDFNVGATSLSSELPRPNTTDRRSPIYIGNKGSYIHEIKMIDVVNGFQPPETVTISNEAFDFKRETLESGANLHVIWTLDKNGNDIPASNARSYLADRNTFSDAAYLNFDFKNTYSKGQDGRFEYEIDDEIDSRMANARNIERVITFALYCTIALFLFMGLRYGLRKDKEYRDQATYFPVSIFKFLILSLFTFNIYTLFWTLKFWNWERKNTDKKISPAWRMMFSVFWLYPAFNTAQKHASEDDAKLPRTMGIVGAAYFAFAIFFPIFIDFRMTKIEAILVLGLTLTASLGFLPAVVTVNRINKNDSEAYRKNSKFNHWNILGILTGSLIIIGNIYSIISPRPPY
ncbi:DUF3857 domain-containing transglutaminase family protein [Roseibium suaedae]|uniref:Transglutaminase-like superfamily protein n=1 Tax=Roseibium suaedae TaxID=735517 RepID=A0A1M7H6B1_9HYPH|nr:DUF3857 and transglutaminase domain-containing protein [Roseibium suaedae]SHM24080.1 Transglutaminase-like superfamily protein [Roseibium suaedae]